MTNLFEGRINAILHSYQEWGEDAVPDRAIWSELPGLDPAEAVTLINFFKFRDLAAYPSSYAVDGTQVTGLEAFNRYAAVSGDCLTKAGGKFLLVSAAVSSFFGKDERWDLVAIGSYPSAEAVLDLFEQPAYHVAYVHRTAGCERERVSICLG